MLRKLVKYEWKATARTLLPLYLGVILLAVLNRILWAPWMGFGESYSSNVNPGVAQGIAMTVYISVIVASFVVTLVILIQRFYKSLLGDEGYLMFTMPVTPAQNIWAKTIIAFLMSVLCAIATTASVFVLASNVELWTALFQNFGDIMRYLFSSYHTPLAIFEVFLAIVVSTVSGILFIYVCIALGHLAKRHRVAMAVVAYFGLSTLLQIIGTQGMLLFGRARWIQQMMWNLDGLSAVHFLMWLMIASSLLIGAGSFLGTNYILSKKLNLE